jgi:DNA ligase-1
MYNFAQTADRIAGTTKKLEKTTLLADYLKAIPVDEAVVAAVFFSGRPFPMWEENTLQVGGTLLWRILEELSGKSDAELTEAYRQYGDLGAVAGSVLPFTEQPSSEHPCPPSAIQQTFREISAARGPAAKAAIVRDLLSSTSPIEAKYIIKIMTGDLRIGLKESLVEEAIAKAFGATLAGEVPRAGKFPKAGKDLKAGEVLKNVQRANMLLGDIGETVRLAAEGRLAETKMRLFHPIGFMLASPADSAEHALSYFQNAWIEDKYDGIRAQAHCSGDTVRFFSRTRDEITESFPELPEALAGLSQDAILDGEIVAWSYLADSTPADDSDAQNRDSTPNKSIASDSGTSHHDSGHKDIAPEERTSLAQRFSAGDAKASNPNLGGTTIVAPEFNAGFKPISGRALPFSALQQRLGRKKVSQSLMRDVPVAYLIFDVLYAGEQLLIDRPLRERARIVDELLSAERKSIHHRDTNARRNSQARFSVTQKELVFGSTSSPITEDRSPTTTLTDDRPTAQIIRAPVFQASSPDALNLLFDAAQARGNEGLMIKDPESLYTPGRRGKSWLKLKRELAMLDVVVTAVEFGHGKRIGVLSDYTFAVRDGDRLLNVGKAYSGLTDAEILEMTKWFLDHTMEDQGFRRTVEPKIVLEVAFNNIMKSDRHSSGYALRFPRIVRLRPDKLPEEADTLERVAEIYARQR